MSAPSLRRRQFFQASATLLAGSVAGSVHSQPPPAVTDPRATDGDERHQPRWDQQLTVTVGPDRADMMGRDDRVIQAAVDYVARLGGGTVKVLPGTFTLRNAIHLPSGIRISGSGADSILTKIASESVALSAESDWYDREITLAQPKDFQVGDAVLLRAKNPHDGGDQVIKRTLVARSGNRFKLDEGLRSNLWL